MAAFQPSEDQAHDLGTTTARWKDVHADKLVISGQNNDETSITSTIGGTLSVENLSVSGTATGIGASTQYSTKETSDDYTIGANDQVVIVTDEHNITLPSAADGAVKGRHLVIINEHNGNIMVYPNSDLELVHLGTGVGVGVGQSVSSKYVLRLWGGTDAWYSTAS